MISRCEIKTKLFCVVFFCCDDFVASSVADSPSFARAWINLREPSSSLSLPQRRGTTPPQKRERKKNSCTPLSPARCQKKFSDDASSFVWVVCPSGARLGSSKKKKDEEEALRAFFAPSPFFCDFFLSSRKKKEKKKKKKRDKSAKHFERTMRGFFGRTRTKKSGEFF